MPDKKHSASPQHIFGLVGEWDAKAGTPGTIPATRDLLKFLSRELYEQYEPFFDKPPFLERLANWLNNIEDLGDQQCLLQFVPWLLFVGQAELESMFRAAMSGPISHWIIDDAGLDICDENLNAQFASELKRTFFGSIAGMDMGSFMRINGLTGQSHRPAFRDEAKIGSIRKFKTATRKYTRFVAVEDMVGTGTQMIEAAPFLEQLAPKPVLLCPLIVAPAGVKTWKDDIEKYKQYSHLSFEPLFVIPANATLPDPFPASHPQELRDVHKVIQKTWPAVRGTRGSEQLYGPFGFGDFGSLVLTYLNCPDNVPPLIHHQSDEWDPLFARSSREG